MRINKQNGLHDSYQSNKITNFVMQMEKLKTCTLFSDENVSAIVDCMYKFVTQGAVTNNVGLALSK